jgi:hypothetical protein
MAIQSNRYLGLGMYSLLVLIKPELKKYYLHYTNAGWGTASINYNLLIEVNNEIFVEEIQTKNPPKS